MCVVCSVVLYTSYVMNGKRRSPLSISADSTFAKSNGSSAAAATSQETNGGGGEVFGRLQRQADEAQNGGQRATEEAAASSRARSLLPTQLPSTPVADEVQSTV